MPTRAAGSFPRSMVLVACALALSAELAAGQKKDTKPSQKDISRELKELYDSDHKDQEDPNWNETTDLEYSRRQKVRRDRVMEIIEAGMLADLQDWDNAALLLQHGESADDFLLAHILSIPSGMEDTPFGKFMCAATLDRFLQNCSRPQIFTTQSGAADPSVYAPAEPFDDSMSQALRAVFGLEPVRGKPKIESKNSKGASAKELPKLLQLSGKEKEPVAGQEAPDWLGRTREIVLSGALKTDKEFDTAAHILLASKSPDDLLSAHVLAMGAAFKARTPVSRAFCAETLDRFLLAIGRKQRFDTVRENGAPREPRMPLQEFILREYGLAGR